MEEKEMSFEEALNKLTEITNRIQRNDCSLDEGFALFEEGMKLSRFCSEKLEVYQTKLQEMTGKLEKDND